MDFYRTEIEYLAFYLLIFTNKEL